MSVDPAAAMFLQRKNSRPEVYTDVHFWTGYFQKAYGKPYFTVCAATENPQRIISSKNNTEIIGSQYYFQKFDFRDIIPLHPYKPSTSSLVRPVIRQISDSG